MTKYPEWSYAPAKIDKADSCVECGCSIDVGARCFVMLLETRPGHIDTIGGPYHDVYCAQRAVVREQPKPQRILTRLRAFWSRP